MNWADFAILAIIAVSAIISLFRGFLREVLSLMAWILAFWLAFSFTPQVAPLLESVIDVPSLRFMLTFAVIFVVSLLLLSLLCHFVVKLIGKTGLTGTDRTMGLLFGIARGGVIILLLVMLAGLTRVPQDPWWQEAQLLPHFEAGALWVSAYLPGSIAENINFEADAAGVI